MKRVIVKGTKKIDPFQDSWRVLLKVYSSFLFLFFSVIRLTRSPRFPPFVSIKDKTNRNDRQSPSCFKLKDGISAWVVALFAWFSPLSVFPSSSLSSWTSSSPSLVVLRRLLSPLSVYNFNLNDEPETLSFHTSFLLMKNINFHGQKFHLISWPVT